MDLTKYFLNAPEDLNIKNAVDELSLLKVYAFNSYFKVIPTHLLLSIFPLYLPLLNLGKSSEFNNFHIPFSYLILTPYI